MYLKIGVWFWVSIMPYMEPPVLFTGIDQGTGSYPPWENGLHLKILHEARAPPFTGPYFIIACAAYSEQLGKYGHFVPFIGERYL
jgi:hypothetical protein